MLHAQELSRYLLLTCARDVTLRDAMQKRCHTTWFLHTRFHACHRRSSALGSKLVRWKRSEHCPKCSVFHPIHSCRYQSLSLLKCYSMSNNNCTKAKETHTSNRASSGQLDRYTMHGHIHRTSNNCGSPGVCIYNIYIYIVYILYIYIYINMCEYTYIYTIYTYTYTVSS